WRTGKPPYAATPLTSRASSSSKTTSKKSRPSRRAASSMITAWYFRAGGRSLRSFIAGAPRSAALAEERLDGVGHVAAVVEARGHDDLLVAERPVQVLLELARAVRALDLPVAELVDAREQLVAQHRNAQLGVPRRPVVAVGVVERVDVPVLGPVALRDLLQAQLVGRADLRAARLAQVEERVLVDDACDRVVDDVDHLEVLVLAAQPRIDPEGLDAHDLLLLAPHRAGHVHHVEDDGRGLRLRAGLAHAVAEVLAQRQDARRERVVGAARERAFERVLERAPEVP